MPTHPRIIDRERRPIPGYDDYYEITRRGHVYSKRLRRMITNPSNTAYDVNGREIIQVEIDRQKVQLGVHKTIVAAWLDEDEQRAILAAVAAARANSTPEESPYKIVGDAFDLRAQTVFYVEELATG